ncbi:MAG: hypothetical protein ACFB01_07120 [Cohaesibacteraceae bacterium]
MTPRTPTPRQLQIAELHRRFGMSPQRAQLLAEHVFGEVRR